MQIGTTKDQCLYNKPSTAVHPGSLAAGTLPQYNTIQHHAVVFVQSKVLFVIVTDRIPEVTKCLQEIHVSDGMHMFRNYNM